MSDRRILIVGDLAAMLVFALIGIASHERDISLTIFARSFLPFVVTWLTLGGVLGAFRHERPSWRLLAIYLVCGVAALVARAVIFDRTLFNAFFVIALVGNGLMLFAWRWLRLGFRTGSEPRRGGAPG
jgi:cation transporter-like permease